MLLRVTLLLTLVLGSLASLAQLGIDLRQEKEAVESSAREFLASVSPSAASAAYNFYDQAAVQVVDGLFTQRAITGVTIINEDQVMIDRQREPERTLPEVGWITQTDRVTLKQDLLVPPEFGAGDVIGSISITVDRSVVPPEIVNRMFSYFLLALLKNFVLGILLVVMVYAALTRYIIALSAAAEKWTPEGGVLEVPKPPRLFLGTEADTLGTRIKQLSDTAIGAIREIEASRNVVMQNNSALNEKSDTLSKAVEARNEELSAANEKLRTLAERDALTGLYNRRHFDGLAHDAFSKLASHGAQNIVGVHLIDVDHFKSYNDYYGHQAGDDVLTQLGQLLSRVSDETGAIVARFGGEEFVALTPSATIEPHITFAARLHEVLAEAEIEHQRSATSDRLTISIGSAIAKSGEDQSFSSIDALLSAADEALYEAKNTGRNRTKESTSAIRSRVRRERQANRALLDAIESRQFEPFFQPQVDARTNALVGAEALVRWRRVDGQVESAESFLAAARRSGLVEMIDAIMLEKISDALTSQPSSLTFLPRLSINLTQESLLSDDYINSLIALHDASPTNIAVELLELALVDKPSSLVLWQFDRLREAGIEIELDDFGTGHTSALGLLAVSPARCKIAKELVMPLNEDARCRVVVKSIISLAKDLGLEPLAEGVECQDIAQALIALGCPMQQGYFHGRPIGLNDFADKMQIGSDLIANG